MRILHIDKIPLKSAAFCIRLQLFACMALFYNWRGSNRLQINFILNFTVETSGTGVRLFKWNIQLWAASRENVFEVHAPDSPAWKAYWFGQCHLLQNIFLWPCVLAMTSTGRVGLRFLCPGTPEGSTGSGSGFKESQKTGSQLKDSSDRLGE